jgi:hypothetical protein
LLKEEKMFAKRILTIVLAASILILAVGSSTSFALPGVEEPDPPDKPGSIQSASAESGLAAVQAPPLSNTFINIVEDTVDNYNPAVAYNSRHDEYLVVWENDRGATRDIYAQRVTGDGTLKSWFTVVSNANKWNYLPDVAYNPVQDEYLIVYTYQVNTSDYDIWARRVKWNGADLGEPQYQAFTINTDSDIQWYPAVAYNDTNDEYLVVYENNWSSSMRDIAAQRVAGVAGGGTSGGELLSWRNIATAPNTVRRLPDVAYNAARNEYLIAYTYQYSPTDGDIYGKTASFNLGTLSSEIHIVDNTVSQDAVALAAGPDEYLAVWNDGGGTTIYGRRVTGTGALQPYIPLATYSGQTHVEPDVAYGDVYGYLVTWRYASSGASGDDIYGRFVRPGQNTPWDDQFAIDPGVDSQRSPALACGARGDCLVVEEDNWPAADYEIRGRFVLAYHVYLPLVMRN